MLNKTLLKCELCGANAHLKYKEHPGFKIDNSFSIYHCESCNTAFSVPRIFDSEELYNNIYKNQHIIPGYSRYWKYAESITLKRKPFNYLTSAEANYWGIGQALKQLKSKEKKHKIIEIGSGLGYLTYALKREGFNIKGLDISKHAVEQATKRFGDYYICDNLFDFAKKRTKNFDIVIMTEVIEHVNEPLKFTQTLLSLLNKNGKLLITTPNKSFYPREVIWATENPPVHCWWFSEDSIKFISKMTKTKVSFIDFEDYYKKHYCSTNLELINKRVIPQPVFDKDWNVINFAFTPSLRQKIRTFVSKRVLNNFINKIRDKYTSDVIRCSKRGNVICAIIEKTEYL